MGTQPRPAIERYLNIRAAVGPTISADNQRTAFLTNITGNMELWQTALDPAGGGWPQQLTFTGDRVLGAVYSPTDPNLLLVSSDRGGNENAQLSLLRLNGDTIEEEIPLTHGFEDAMHGGAQWLPGGTGILFSANRRRPDRFDLYLQPLDGPPNLVYAQELPGYLWHVTVSPAGREAIAVRMESSFSGRLLRINLDPGNGLDAAQAEDISPGDGPVRFYAPHYSADGRSLYLLTDYEANWLYLARLDMATRNFEPLVQPSWNVEALAQSADKQQLVYAVNEDGASKLSVLDVASGASRHAPTSDAFVLDQTRPPTFSADGRLVVFAAASATRTSDVYVWDLAADAIRPITHSNHGGLAATAFRAPTLITYPTFDGRDIPAWYYPPVTGQGPAPCVVVVHGGPESQSRPTFNFVIQYLVASGYAVLAPNVRGSTGYGRAYAALDNVRQRMDSVTDLAHANQWLRAQPEIDNERIIVYGGSYGGFMVLSALTTYPDLWAAGVDIVGISSFVTFLENTSSYRRAHREAEYGSLADDRDFLAEISPLAHVDNITAPLFIIHGRNDPRVPVTEAEQLAASLETRDVPVELLVFEDEGHGIAKLRNKRVMYPRVIAFLDQIGAQ